MKKKPKRRRRHGVSAELKRIYRDAEKDGIWIREWAGGMAAAGLISTIEEIEKRLGREIDIEKDLTLGDIVMGALALPGNGATREEACRNAVAACKRHHKIP